MSLIDEEIIYFEDSCRIIINSKSNFGIGLLKSNQLLDNLKRHLNNKCIKIEKKNCIILFFHLANKQVLKIKLNEFISNDFLFRTINFSNKSNINEKHTLLQDFFFIIILTSLI